MGLWQKHDDCADCQREQVCAELRASLSVDEIDFSIADDAIVLLFPDMTPIICRFCPHCGRKLRIWHSKTGWHITEVDP